MFFLFCLSFVHNSNNQNTSHAGSSPIYSELGQQKVDRFSRSYERQQENSRIENDDESDKNIDLDAYFNKLRKKHGENYARKYHQITHHDSNAAHFSNFFNISMEKHNTVPTRRRRKYRELPYKRNSSTFYNLRSNRLRKNSGSILNSTGSLPFLTEEVINSDPFSDAHIYSKEVIDLSDVCSDHEQIDEHVYTGPIYPHKKFNYKERRDLVISQYFGETKNISDDKQYDVSLPNKEMLNLETYIMDGKSKNEVYVKILTKLNKYSESQQQGFHKIINKIIGSKREFYGFSNKDKEKNYSERIFARLDEELNSKYYVLPKDISQETYSNLNREYETTGYLEGGIILFLDYSVKVADKFSHLFQRIAEYSIPKTEIYHYATKKEKSSKEYFDEFEYLKGQSENSLLFFLLPELNFIYEGKKKKPDSFFINVDFLMRYCILKSEFLKKKYSNIGKNLKMENILKDILHLRSILFLVYYFYLKNLPEYQYFFILFYLTYLNAYVAKEGKKYENFMLSEENYIYLKQTGILEGAEWKKMGKTERRKKITVIIENLNRLKFDDLENEKYKKKFDEQKFMAEILKRCDNN